MGRRLMAWAKIDDQWFANRKVVPLSLAARGLWTTVLAWTCAQRTPIVPGHMPGFLCGVQFIDTEVKELVDAGLWHEVDGGWEIHDWAEYQDRSLSEKRAEAGRKGGLKSGEVRASEATETPSDEAKPKQTDVASESNDEAGTRPGPTRPGPKDVPPAAPAQRKRSLSDQWAPNDSHSQRARESGVDVEFEAGQFRDHHLAKGSKFVDWDRAFHTWLGNATKWKREKAQASGEGRPKW